MVATGQDAADRVAPNAQLHPGNNGLGREHVADIQRARILAAMFDVVAENGVANVTVAHIVARSGVSRRTFYELFADREDCFLAAFDEAIRRIASVMAPAFDEEHSWRAGVQVAVIALLEWLEGDPATGRLVFVESLGAGPRALARRESVLAQVVSFVDRGRAAGKRGEGPPPLTAEGVVGGVLSVLHSRLFIGPPGSGESDGHVELGRIGSSQSSDAELGLMELAGPLTSMIVLPYLGQAAARRELGRPVLERDTPRRAASADPLRDVDMRLTYRTVRVLMAVAEHPGASNREVGVASGMSDQGQISKLLSRLHRLELIANTGVGPAKGAPNAWTLTPRGHAIHTTIGVRAGG
jgi:AcrR family transcriptional regulator